MGQLVVQEFVTADGFAANTNNEFTAYEMLAGGSAEFDRSQLAWLDTVDAMLRVLPPAQDRAVGQPDTERGVLRGRRGPDAAEPAELEDL